MPTYATRSAPREDPLDDAGATGQGGGEKNEGDGGLLELGEREQAGY